METSSLSSRKPGPNPFRPGSGCACPGCEPKDTRACLNAGFQSPAFGSAPPRQQGGAAGWNYSAVSTRAGDPTWVDVEGTGCRDCAAGRRPSTIYDVLRNCPWFRAGLNRASWLACGSPEPASLASANWIAIDLQFGSVVHARHRDWAGFDKTDERLRAARRRGRPRRMKLCA